VYETSIDTSCIRSILLLTNELLRMAKRKPQPMSESEDEGLQEVVDVDFDFYDLVEDDFHALSNLLKQLLSHDAKDFDVSGIADCLIHQKLGSTVKCDGLASAAYAFCTVYNPASTTVRYLHGGVCLAHAQRRTPRSFICPTIF
jgi:hypothetical protein